MGSQGTCMEREGEEVQGINTDIWRENNYAIHRVVTMSYNNRKNGGKNSLHIRRIKVKN